MLCLPRLAVLVSTEADRPEAWFPGALGPYAAWFPGIGLSRYFERVEVPENLMKVRLKLLSLASGLGDAVRAAGPNTSL